MQDIDNVVQAYEILVSAFKRFQQLDNQQIPFSKEQRVEFDVLGGLLSDIRKLSFEICAYRGD